MKLVPLVSIGVQREGATIYPPVGKAFDFTEGEKDDLDKLAASTKLDYYREPVNEESGVEAKATKAKGKTVSTGGNADL